MDGLRFFFERRDYGYSVALFIAMQNGDKRSAAKPIEFEDYQDGLVATPALEMRPEEAQAMLDGLWQAGFRPSKAPEGDSIKAHLADMRAITFAKLNIPRPEQDQ